MVTARCALPGRLPGTCAPRFFGVRSQGTFLTIHRSCSPSHQQSDALWALRSLPSCVCNARAPRCGVLTSILADQPATMLVESRHYWTAPSRMPSCQRGEHSRIVRIVPWLGTVGLGRQQPRRSIADDVDRGSPRPDRSGRGARRSKGGRARIVRNIPWLGTSPSLAGAADGSSSTRQWLKSVPFEPATQSSSIAPWHECHGIDCGHER